MGHGYLNGKNSVPKDGMFPSLCISAQAYISVTEMTEK